MADSTDGPSSSKAAAIAAKKAAARKGKKKEPPAEGAPEVKGGAPGAIRGVLTWDVSLVGIFMLLVLMGFYVVSKGKDCYHFSFFFLCLLCQAN